MLDNEILSIDELRYLAGIGGSALKAKMPEAAGNICSAIIPFCPSNSNGPIIGLAMAKFGQSQCDDAIALLKDHALVNDPMCADSHAHLALILRATGEREESEQYLSVAIEQCVDDALSELIEKIERGLFDSALARTLKKFG